EELCPFSDIDLMFLYPDRARGAEFAAEQAYLNDSLLYPLWDLGLKVGHGTRTPKDAITEARAEVQSKNAMLEARVLCGDPSLAKRFNRQFQRFIRKENARLYIEERLEDQIKRRGKFDHKVFLQEPDIKNGVGGLRDYQNILWIVRLKLGQISPEVLLDERLLRADEQAAFRAAYDFLLRVRNELHFGSKRATDVLDLEKQPQIAANLGWGDEDIFIRVERFMRAYYRAAKRIYETSTYLEERLLRDARTTISFAAVIESRRRGARSVRSDVFEIGPFGLTADHPRVFREDPVRLIRVFRIRQQLRTRFSLELTRLVTSELDLIDDALRQSPEANRALRSILQARGEVADTMRAMHRTGVLSRFLPEWGELECLVQHEYYHRYTADEHTLTTLDQLDFIFQGSDPAVFGNYRDAIERTDLPGLLYLVLLLHDIGKGRGVSGHAEAGAEMAQAILARMGVAPSVRERILFLIRGHLEMARFWQHYDIDDARTIRKFARWVEDAEKLRYLYVLTFCDARATAQQLWNSYKDALHTQLFRASLDELGESAEIRYEMISKSAIAEKVPDLSEDEIEAHYNLLPERYFVYSDAEEVALHLRMVNGLLRTIAEADSLGSLVPVVEWREDLDLGLMVVHVVTWDRAGLFFKLAGAFSVAGLSIVSSRALTRADHITIDTFYVSGPDGGIVRDAKVRETFQEALESVLLHNRDLLPMIEERAAQHRRRAYLQTDERLRAPLPSGVDVYHELSLRRTIIEVQATDQIGLLYRLARAIFVSGFDISFARIATERNVAVDTFYIEPIDRSKESNTEDLLELRRALTEIVEKASEDSY
ncbi:MAG: [protein-PII] uridylyltransferase, partial [Opitutales bacterium]